MRELKFRAYDSATGKVSEPFDVKESWGDYLIDFEDYSTDGALDSIIWEQFTGLLDRNGKEIYEGDIVKTCSIGTWAVEGRRGCFFVGKYALYGYNDYGEVIGNIHENPELLEEK